MAVALKYDPEDYPDVYIADILKSVKTIAMLGASDNEFRPSYGVMRYLQKKGYRVIPINPRLAGKELHGETVYAELSDVPLAIDMVDIFRRTEDLPEAMRESIGIGAKVIWAQLGLRDDDVAAWAEAQGLRVVMNRCPAIEIPRLGL
ncbi:CoA-binding protein [Govanella unica]|uniref:CoA-binding protein n=1 Tax=Govanella unica TaxID=2975056 RepID=A0A9X3TY35_9PROT|nr:CoA-binding protein [Govania unica]MDA5193492.1 CoA-binding protein [Govania unica]